MAPMLHTGFEHHRFYPVGQTWARTSTSSGSLAESRHVAPMTLINAMVYSGLFERHPKLTLLLAEVGVGWLPFTYREIDDRIAPVARLFFGDWNYPLKPSEYLARNVKGTPLTAGNDSPLLRIMDDLPQDMIVFSSDFPHFEGIADPKDHYSKMLGDLPAQKGERFFGGTIAEVYARMSDPIA